MSNKRQPIPFGKYLLLDRVNIGGMAEVWKAKTFGAEGFEKLVAIKRILPNIAEDEEFIAMFIDEAKISVQLTHANVAQVFDLGKIGDSYYIAMEYVSGKDLRAIFDKARKRGEPAPIPLVCYALSKSCEGLDYAHRKKDTSGNDLNIVHRDVSPQNILVSYDGECKVIDFGIAKAANKATKTQAGILKGKFGYMSPEQVRGLPLDRRSDVFALGVTLYEMLTGERLFVGESDFSVLEKVRAVDILPPSTYNRRIPPALEKIVLKALAKEVEDRFQYANELGDELQRFLITSDSIFSRKDLMQFMKSTFAEDVEREKVKLQEYDSVKLPAGMAALAGISPASPPPQRPITQPPPAPESDSTVIGMKVEGTDPGMGRDLPAPPPPRVPGPPPGRSTSGGMPALRPGVPGPPVGAPGGAPRGAVPGPPPGRTGSMAPGRAPTGVVSAIGSGGAPSRRPTGQIPAFKAPPVAPVVQSRPPSPTLAPPIAQAESSIADDLEEELADSTLPPKNKGRPSRPPAPNVELDDEQPEPTSPRGHPKSGGGKGLLIGGIVGGLGLVGVCGVGAMLILRPTGTLLVQVTPAAGASVLVDGQPNAQPGNYAFSSLKAGTHQMVVTEPGYELHSETVNIEKDQTNIVKVVLKKEGGEAITATVVENVAGAEISIDGAVVRAAGEKGMYTAQMDGARDHTLTLKAEGFKTVTKQFAAGKPVMFQETMEADPSAAKAPAPAAAPSDDKDGGGAKGKKASDSGKGSKASADPKPT